MPEPIEIMAQEMTRLRQGFTAMQARMESTQSKLEATQSRLNEVENARSLTGQLSSKEATGFSVEEMRDPLTNLVEWLNEPKTKTPAARLQAVYNNRENPTILRQNRKE